MPDPRRTCPEPLSEREAAGIDGGQRTLRPIVICDPLPFTPTCPLPIPTMPAF